MVLTGFIRDETVAVGRRLQVAPTLLASETLAGDIGRRFSRD